MKSSAYFEKFNTQMLMVNYLRWADVFRFEKRFQEAEITLSKADEILSSGSFPEYQDFYFQHLGKLYFDRGNFAEAVSCFEKALLLRNKKGNQELISSTEFALKITKKKI